jgi:hypothetical protein
MRASIRRCSVADARAGVLWLGVGVLAGAAIAWRSTHVPPLAVWGALAAVGFGTAVRALATGRETQQPQDGTVFGGTLVGIGAAMLVGGEALAVALLLAALAVVTRQRPLGRLVRPLLGGAPLFYGALAVGHAADGWVPWALATWLFALRTAVSSEVSGVTRWVAATLALAYVPASLLLPARSAYTGYYFLTVLFADLALLVVGTRLLVGRIERLVGFVNTALSVTVVALVVGRVL